MKTGTEVGVHSLLLLLLFFFFFFCRNSELGSPFLFYQTWKSHIHSTCHHVCLNTAMCSNIIYHTHSLSFFLVWTTSLMFTRWGNLGSLGSKGHFHQNAIGPNSLILHSMTIRLMHTHKLDTLYLYYGVKGPPGVIWGNRGQKVIFTKYVITPPYYIA